MTINQESPVTLEEALERHDVAAVTLALHQLTETGDLANRMTRLSLEEARQLARLLGRRGPRRTAG